ncbi:hypothetical protein [Ructibacterium gallinarum]|uniref:S-layer homology domain-containing protein n=1 Tax=Ructibacterium gallinarum TaxID=2779355 RepID=A0A9D5M414_9FIRM|nr:hypothetical protein [Ructibacterium gallinarum]MBE5039154.1 hypothetical protein [Ructibacterium gallinarum]
MVYRKIISSLLILFTVFLCCANAAFAETGEYTVDEAAFAVKIAQGLGAVANYDPEQKVTVADLKKAVDSLSNHAGASSLYFENSQADSQEIKCGTAAAVICDMLGYGIFASNHASDKVSTDEMFLVARKYGILDGVAEGQEDILTMQSMVTMLYHALHAKALETSYYGDGTWNSSITDQTYMEAVLHMEIINGIVETTKFSSIKEEEGTETNHIVISGVSYVCDLPDFEQYIGMEVKALAGYVEDQRKVLALYSDGRAMEISAKDLETEKITEDKIWYFNENGTSRSLSIAPGADVLYNFKLLKDWSEEDFKITQGRLVCIDNNRDGRYEVVKIEEYKSMRIFSASVQSQKISDPNGETISIKDLIEKGYPVYEKGQVILPENIQPGSVATYFLDKTGEVTAIYINSDIAAGTVNRFEKEENQIFLDGETYFYTDEIKEALEKVEYGTCLTVSLNIYGEIAYFEKSKDAFLYGYLISFSSDNGFSNPKVRIFTQTNEIKVYETADKINFNGVKQSSNEAFQYDLSTGLWDEAGKINQIIKYRVNANQLVTAIRTASNYDTGDSERLLKEKDGVYTYYSAPNTICGDTRLNVSTKVFLIPTDLREESRYKCGGPEVLGNDTDYTCQVYDIDENRYADVVVARIDPYGTGSPVDDLGGAVYMVENIGTYINNRGEESVFVDAHQLGQAEPTTVQLKFNRKDIPAQWQSLNITAEDLQRGDIIMTAEDSTVNHTGEMANFLIWYRPGVTEPYEVVKQYWYSATTVDTFMSDGNCYTAGKVIRLVENGVILNNQPEDTENYDAWNRIITLSSSTPVYILDKNRKSLVQGSIADLMPGDTVFSFMRNALPDEMIIYRNFE